MYYPSCACRSGKVQGPGVQFTLVNGRQLPDGSYQRPSVALVCNFPSGAAAPLSVIAVQTLFHEFGHVRPSIPFAHAHPPPVCPKLKLYEVAAFRH